MRILVVDDDYLGREILLSFLEEYGVCESACDGGEALDKFHAAHEAGMPYDLICLDVHMPVLDGNHVLAEIRKTEETASHKSCVFIITAYESPQLIDDISGADDFISKPCSANLIKRLFERHHLLGGIVSVKHHALVVSGDPKTRNRIMKALSSDDISLTECATFREAEQVAVTGPFSAIIADVPTIVKAKDDERLAVFSLQNIYPLVRVKTSGDLIVPIIMKQKDRGQSLTVHLEKICSTFLPRRLRAFKRHNSFIPVQIRKSDGLEYQTFTMDISWGGAFIVMNSTWGMATGTILTVGMPTLGITIVTDIVRIQPWGEQGVAPGIGVKWEAQHNLPVLEGLHKIFKTDINEDRDRLLG